jgi:hypothetical protein
VLQFWNTERQKHERLRQLIFSITTTTDPDIIDASKKDFLDLYNQTKGHTIIESNQYNKLLDEIKNGKLIYNVPEVTDKCQAKS